ncbi:MAG TPA: histidine kinase [Thermoleophilaceae bacterium]|jgi:two-component system sensor histidine kinase UhpB
MTTTEVPAAGRHNHWRVSLPWRVFLGNSIVLGIAIVILAFTPATVTVPTHLDEAVVFVGGLTAILLTNLALLRRVFAPLRRLTRMMSQVQPLEPGARIPIYGDDAEVVELTRAFNDMLERLEDERRESAHRSIEAQEGERRHVAQELHDEIGQTLTAIVLQLDRLARRAPSELRSELEETRESARESLEDVRRIAQRLRPETLEDLGLSNALEALCDRVGEHAGIRMDSSLDGVGATVGPETELVIYRVAQEALTNVLRHAGAGEVFVELRRADHDLILRVADDGVGIDPEAERGGGLQGMRERALLVGGRVSVKAVTDGGTEVMLRVPIEEAT